VIDEEENEESYGDQLEEKEDTEVFASEKK
jgi:hypothetical protein